MTGREDVKPQRKQNGSDVRTRWQCLAFHRHLSASAGSRPERGRGRLQRIRRRPAVGRQPPDAASRSRAAGGRVAVPGSTVGGGERDRVGTDRGRRSNRQSGRGRGASGGGRDRPEGYGGCLGHCTGRAKRGRLSRRVRCPSSGGWVSQHVESVIGPDGDRVRGSAAG